MKKLKKITMEDFIGVLKFIILIIPAFIYKTYNRLIQKKVFLISEHYTARDNGYFFYKYMRENHKNIKCYYAMDKNCKDYEKVKELGNIIQWGSFKHYFYYMGCTNVLVSHKNGDPNHPLFGLLIKYFNLYNKVVFLQHGITKDNIPNFYYKNAKFKRFICGAKPEYDYIKKIYGYPTENVVYTGFARFDNLHNIKINDDIILLMPTWRRWLNSEKAFLDSKYYNSLQNFINNKELDELLKKNNKKIIFCPHFGSKDYFHNFSTKSKNITIINPEEADIQKLLIESAVLITDYSSVCFDFAYMRKNLVYFQFDTSEYREKHLEEGYFDYERDGFGKVVDNEKELIEELERIIVSGNKLNPIYEEKINNFFPIYDCKNSERIYNEIINIKK